MNNIKSFHNVSAFYFFLLAFIYIAGALLLKAGYYQEISLLIMRLLDIPFIGVGLLYGGTGLYLQINSGEAEEEGSPWNMVIFAACLLLFGIAVFANFAFPSVI